MKPLKALWQRKIDYSSLPFTDLDNQSWPKIRLQMSKDVPLQEGTSRVAEKILSTTEGKLHWELAESLAQGLRCSYEHGRELFNPPAYGVSVLGNGIIWLELLPDFKYPSRFVECYLRENDVLRIEYLEFSLDPRLGPINVGKFRSKYEIQNEDLLLIRNTCLDVLTARRAPIGSRPTEFLHHGFEHASGSNDAIYASCDQKIVWET